MDKVFIRLLNEVDAGVSWQWRNDPEVWKFTGKKPDKPITYEIELDWIQKVLTRNNEIRFAICEKGTEKYIGNVQLTNINGYDAQFHIFIGDKDFWGKGFGSEATRQMVEYGFNELKLQSIYLDVKLGNLPAIKAYQKAGFSDIFEHDEYHRMAIFITDKILKKLSVFVMTYNHEMFIGEALEGMLMQQVNFEFDIVVGDDFSNDNTRMISQNYAIKYPGKFKLLFYPRNVSAAINQIWVLKNCFGKYIAMCEGDDYWTDPNKLQKQVDFLETNSDYAICFHRVYELVEGNNPELSSLNTSPNLETYTIEDLAKGNFIHTPSVVFRNGLITELPVWFKDSPVGDYPLHMLNAAHGKIRYFPEAMAVYRRHANGVWGKKSQLHQSTGWVWMLEHLAAEFKDSSIAKILLKQKAENELYIANFQKDAGNEDEYFKWLHKACCSSYVFFVEWTKEQQEIKLKPIEVKVLELNIFDRMKRFLKIHLLD